MYDAVMIVDQYQRYHDGQRNNYTVDVDREAQGLSMLLNPLGRRNRRIAIVEGEDEEGIKAYNSAGFELVKMNGDRVEKLYDFIDGEKEQMRERPPQQLVLVSSDRRFKSLCCDLDELDTKVSVWPPTTNVPPQLAPFVHRPLDELLPGLKIRVARVDVRLDYENLHIGLEQAGWTPNTKGLVDAVKAATADLGNVVRVIAYADWDELAKGKNGGNFQRDLAVLGIKTRYQVSMHGKNSADMELVSEVNSQIDRSDAIDTYVVGTGDRDFRPLIEYIQSKNKKAIVLALRSNLSGKLAQVADEVRYLDEHIRIRPTVPYKTYGASNVRPTDKQTDLVVRWAAWQRKRYWKFIRFGKPLDGFLASNPYEQNDVDQAVAAGLLVPWQDHTDALCLNLEHPLSKTAYHLVWWIESRVDFCLNKKGMKYIDSNYLARGMQMDRKFKELNVGQTRFAAEKWLQLAANAGVVVRREQPHPKVTEKVIVTWWLPGQEPDTASEQESSQATALNVKEKHATATTLTQKSVQELNIINDVPESTAPDKSELLDILTSRFDEEEIKTLCFRLGIDYEILSGKGKIGKARELIRKLQRERKLGILLQEMKQECPDIASSLKPKDSEVILLAPVNRGLHGGNANRFAYS